METTYQKPSSQGYYGKFGGAYIPEMLHRNVEELQSRYLDIMSDAAFQKEFRALLKDYVGRPTPLFYAKRLSKQFKTNIWLKREDLCHTGAHKINNTVGQILLAERLGKKRIIAETGAGQHGVATATVCALKGVECIVYMGEKDIERQAPNVARMKMLGATVVPATSGSKTLKDATNEAIRDWINNPNDTHYSIGSVVGPHPYPDMVAKFQSVISEEMRWQLKEHTGKDLGLVHFSAHSKLLNWTLGTQKTYKTNVENVTDVFHVYSIDWTKDMIKFYIDGVLYYNVGNDGRGVDAYPFMAPEFLLLNVAVGGNFAGNTIDDTIFPCRMVVDYVRVYQ